MPQMSVARLLFLINLRHLFGITFNLFSVCVAFIALSLLMIFDLISNLIL